MASNDILKSKQLIDEFNKVWDEHAKFIGKANESLKKFSETSKLPSSYTQTLQQITKNNKELANGYDKVVTAQKKVTTSQKALERERIKELRLASKREKAFDKMDAKMKREARQAERQSKLEEKLSSSYYKLTQELSKAEKKYRDLAASQGISNKETIKAQKNVQNLRNRIDSINVPIKRFGDNVGNYKSAFKGLGASLRGFMGAFGMVGGIYLFANVLRNTFSRVREFNKELKTLEGIAGNNITNINRLEKTIVRVAGASVKTSNEVAKLATTLFSLGKTQDEVEMLLEPVNNLGIALDATSDDAGRLLVGTLNAFGDGAEEADRYANVIAKMRTSTALDFQQINDSMGYIAPTARALNLSLEETGAIVGVLADNNIRGERAGRLMSTALLRLSKNGLKLNDVLDQINKMQKQNASETQLAAYAAKQFGAQAAPLALILANNRDKVSELTTELKNSKGALDELTNKQLESLDAKLKILDSTWESFILSIENGDGVISKFIRGTLDVFIKSIKGLQETLQGFENSQRDITFGDKFKELKRANITLDEAQKQLNNYRKAIVATEKELQEAEDSIWSTRWQRDEIKKNIGFLKGNADAYREYIKSLKDANKEESKIGTGATTGTGAGTPRKKTKEKDLIGLDPSKVITMRQEVEQYIKTTKKMRDAHFEMSPQWNELNELLEHYLGLLDSFVVKGEDITEMSQRKAEAFENEEKTLRKLQQATDDFVSSFSDSFFSDMGLGSIEIFFDGTFERLMYGAESLGEKFAVTFNAIAEVGQEAFNLISQASQRNFEAEYERLEQQKEISIRFAGDSSAAREEIEKQYEARRKKIQKRQAEANKRIAIFNATIDTAQAVVSQLAEGGYAAAIAAAVLGAAQIAIIASQEIPQFWQGGVVGDNQRIMVNDDPYGKKGANYKEVIQKPNGQILKPQGKNVIMDVPKGTIVHPTYKDFDESLNQMLENNGVAPFNNIGSSIIAPVINNGLSKGELIDVMNNHASKLVNTINNKHGISVNIDEAGLNTFVTKGNAKKQILNARFRGKGNNV